MRGRELGIEIGRGQPGPHNAITDVAGKSFRYYEKLNRASRYTADSA